jgi:hypothetical protein
MDDAQRTQHERFDAAIAEPGFPRRISQEPLTAQSGPHSNRCVPRKKGVKNA